MYHQRALSSWSRLAPRSVAEALAMQLADAPPRGVSTFTVEMTAKTRGGKTLHGQRVYHTCHLKLPGHKYLPL